MSKYGEVEQKVTTGYYTNKDKELYEESRRRKAAGEKYYRDDCRKEFQQDCYEAFEITDNPKANRLWDLCWGNGHSEGYHRVFQMMDEWVDLIK